jgi:serine/threonine-protein kinase
MSDEQSGRAAGGEARGASGADRAARSQAVDPLVGRTLHGRFRITGLIARGGMGKVYQAEQAPLGRVCALKVLAPRYDGDHDPEFHRRFFLEASTAAKINHPNTVTIFDYGQADDSEVYFIAMEYIEGRTLYRALRDDGPFPETRAAHVARQICRGVREAHKIGVVHRDLKPGNVLLSDHGDEHDLVKVLDFGLVKVVTGSPTGDLTETGLFMGSPKYMAPEQILGGEISARTDLYAIGVMLYEMLCGKVPFDRGANMATLMAHVNDPLPPMAAQLPGLALSPAMEAIVERCLAKDPVARYASTDELLVALRQIGAPSPYATHEGLPAAVAPASVAAPTRLGPEPLLGAPTRDPLDPGTTRPSPGAPAPAPSFSGTPTWLEATDAPREAPPPEPASLPSGSWSRAQDGAPDTLREGARPVSGPPTSGGDSLGAAQRTAIDDDPELAALRARARRGPWPRVGAMVAIAVAAGGLAVALSGGKAGGDGAAPGASASAATTATSAATTTTQGAATTTGGAEAPAGPRVVRVESEPAGASVSEAGKPLCAPTPCDAPLGDADGARVLSIE